MESPKFDGAVSLLFKEWATLLSIERDREFWQHAEIEWMDRLDGVVVRDASGDSTLGRRHIL